MTTVKRTTNLTEYAAVLPYDSELFGVYQPLLGWKSARIEKRFQAGFEQDKRLLLQRLTRNFAGVVNVDYRDTGQLQIQIEPGVMKGGMLRSYDSTVLKEIASKLPPYDAYKPAVWASVISEENLSTILKKNVVDYYTKAYAELRRIDTPAIDTGRRVRTAADAPSEREIGAFKHQLQYESAVAGMLLLLQREKNHDTLVTLFYSTKDTAERAHAVARMLASSDSATAYLSLESLNPTDREQLSGVVLSPISVVHLFRQYFFQLDTFLGPPISHVWLSPGSTVELIEIHTRRSTIEKTLETALETLTSSETTTTQQEELSEAVKQDNQQDIKFGASVTASYGSIEATSSFDYANSQKLAREATHKRMRQQTEKLSSQIRRNFKSTFKTVTEFTDVSSTKHVLANTTNDLINYELRRKMQQVSVQVQDIGTYLCWQTYVDDPGRDLGLAELVHIAKPADLDSIPHPEELPLLQACTEEKLVTIPFISIEGTGADSEGEVYVDGVEQDNSEWFGNLEKIQADFTQEVVSPRANYELTNVEFDPMGNAVSLSRKGQIQNSNEKASFVIHLDSADFRGQNTIQAKLILHWAPQASANDAIVQKNKENIAAFKAAERAAYEKAYIETVKDRVNIASKIQSRNTEELREEERIAIYRQLIQGMLMNGITMPDDRSRHVVAEVLNAIFDVDKMLYFVAPEWWRPRLHRSRQQLQERPDVPPRRPPVGPLADTVLAEGLLRRTYYAGFNAPPTPVSLSTVAWGGLHDTNRDNYYITEDSAPAKLGSSLGWLLQLDGDNMRNAFLNAPWVKAVIPIRPGKEEAAINWLKGVEGMNGITDDVIYHASSAEEKDIDGNPLEGQKMIDVLVDLAKKIRKKYEEGVESGKYPEASEVSDPALVDEESTVTATPIDRVYEHGFYPLAGGFRANVGKNYEIFDQWVEILPTDQSVPVPVAYDPQTGRQV
jgi:hypothetical protein